jgi:hypothetical protein
MRLNVDLDSNRPTKRHVLLRKVSLIGQGLSTIKIMSIDSASTTL